MCNYRKSHWSHNWEGKNENPDAVKFVYKRRGHLLGFLIRAFLLKVLWNFLVPTIFGGPHIGFLHAIGILFLGKVITGGAHARCHHARGHKKEWKRKMKEKMEKMSPEERKEFKEKMMGWEVNVIEVEDEEEDDLPDTKGDGEDKKES